MQTNILCQSCSMPLDSEQLFGTEKSGEKSQDYCRYCYEAGEFKEPNLSLEEMIAICIPHMEAGGMKAKEAETILRETLPFLKRWRKQPKTWLAIWEFFKTSDQERTYTGDYELYDERREQVEIYIAIKA